ncbi:MAG TPA: ATP-binding protein, partial [Burkholderiaceae bacterium]
GFECAAAEVDVRGDAVTLHEIVMNLVDNAIRYTQPGGIVTTRIVVAPGTAMLTVEDNGPGIPESERERVLERFYRLADQDSDGCGLGLAIVKEFTSQLGARLTLRTAAGGTGLAVDVAFDTGPAREPA